MLIEKTLVEQENLEMKLEITKRAANGSIVALETNI